MNNVKVCKQFIITCKKIFLRVIKTLKVYQKANNVDTEELGIEVEEIQNHYESKLYTIISNRLSIDNVHIMLLANNYLVVLVEIKGLTYPIAELQIILEKSNSETYLGLNHLFVDIHFRKMGIASLLLDYAYWYAKKNGLNFLFLVKGSTTPNYVDINKLIGILGICNVYVSDSNLNEFYKNRGFLTTNNGSTFFKKIH